MEASLFFIAVLPDRSLSEEIVRFKRYAAEHFGSSRALRSPPHITLFPPFKWPAWRVEELCRVLGAFADGEKRYSFPLSGFDCFAPRVIFVKVGDSAELVAMQRRLRERLAADLHLAGRDDRPYHPHLTVAFKDLRRSVFPQAWAHFSPLTYERTFAVDRITLLEHNGREWEVFRDFYLEA